MPGLFKIGGAVSIGRAIEPLLLIGECAYGEREKQVQYPPLYQRLPIARGKTSQDDFRGPIRTAPLKLDSLTLIRTLNLQ